MANMNSGDAKELILKCVTAYYENAKQYMTKPFTDILKADLTTALKMYDMNPWHDISEKDPVTVESWSDEWLGDIMSCAECAGTWMMEEDEQATFCPCCGRKIGGIKYRD